MTTALRLVMTTAGLGRFTAAQVQDDIDLTIAKVGFTDTVFIVAPTLTALPGEFRRVATVSGQAASDNIVHMIVRDDAALTYQIRGFGLFLADGTLFAVYGQDTPIGQKSERASLLLAIDIAFPTSDVANLVFGDTNFLNPPATTTTKGIVELATDQETADGTDAARAVTPKSLQARLAGLFLGRRVNVSGLAVGGGELSADVTIGVPAASAAEADAGAISTKAVTPLSLVNILSSILARVPLTRRVDTSGLAIGGNALGTDITISVPAATAAQLIAGGASNVAATPAALASAGVIYLVESKVDGANRYRRFSDGSVEMMGVSSFPGSESTFVLNFPWPFPTTCDGIWGTIINSSQTNDGQSTMQEVSLSAASAQLYAQNHKTPTADASGGFRWFARGH